MQIFFVFYWFLFILFVTLFCFCLLFKVLQNSRQYFYIFRFRQQPTTNATFYIQYIRDMVSHMCMFVDLCVCIWCGQTEKTTANICNKNFYFFCQFYFIFPSSLLLSTSSSSLLSSWIISNQYFFHFFFFSFFFCHLCLCFSFLE